MKGKSLHHTLVLLNHLEGCPSQVLVRLLGFARGRQESLKVFDRHGHGPRDQVSKIICQISIEPPYKGLLAEIRIEAKDHLPEQEIPEGIQAIFVSQIQRPHYISQALRHLPRIYIPVAMDIKVLVRLNPGCLEHTRPIYPVGL